MATVAAVRQAPERLLFADDGQIPNSPLPVLVYRQLPLMRKAPAFEELFARHGWSGAWCDGIFPFHHFHSNTHEVLGVARGWGEVTLGGPAGQTVRFKQGDVLVLPAGVGHKLERASSDFLVVGAYPDGRDWDIRRGEAGERALVLGNLACVPLPAQDPVYGQGGPLLAVWTGRSER